MKCPYCSTLNRDSRRFCGHCGVALGWCCSRCGFFNVMGEHYCGGCGVAQSGGPTVTVADQPAQSARAVSPRDATRSALIKEEIHAALLERAAGSADGTTRKPVSQDDIDSLFRS